MSIEKYNLAYDFIEKTTLNIKGGYGGLKFLFDKFISDMKELKCVINHTNFHDFIDGKEVLIGTPENYSKSGSPYNFETFYERMFKFECTGSGYISNNNNILEYIVANFATLFSKNDLGKKEKKTVLKQFLLILVTHIKESDNCTEIENPKLYPKLIYLKNGYIKTYNTIFDLYGGYLKGFDKVDFNNKMQISVNLAEENSKELKKSNSRIFINDSAFTFFELVKEKLCINERTILADYSFIFRKMSEDKLIHKAVKELEFREFLVDDYEISLDKLKVFNRYNSKSEILYNSLKS
ncbi:hypothetical protein FFWV33_02320 [Flavobacterium faecale]|uniref:Uncharacterized protein n=1 Tax=Flavobacterium faecale TaxID=1355330 RepID=A0A2S1L9N5_9FLAO|nr:hypothetical protein [Flavobacterium faecale]AWG20445.1 hypothetical protein FFWV33_02320 [Flavobacterium faecale]